MIFKREGTVPCPQIQRSISAHSCLSYFLRERVICQKADNKRSVWEFSVFILNTTSKRNGKALFFFICTKANSKDYYFLSSW